MIVQYKFINIIILFKTTLYSLKMSDIKPIKIYLDDKKNDNASNTETYEILTTIDQSTTLHIMETNDWKWIYNYIKYNPEHIEFCLYFCKPELINQTLVDWLATDGIISFDNYISFKRTYLRFKNKDRVIKYKNLVATINSFKHWQDLFCYIYRNPDNINEALKVASDDIYTNDLLHSLNQEYLITDDDLVELLKRVKGNKKPKLNSPVQTEDLLLDRNELINNIKNITNDLWLYNYIKNHPQNVHICLSYCSWNAFTPYLIKRLLKEGPLDPYKMNSAYDFDTNININFVQYIKLLYKEVIEADDQDKKEVLEEIYEMIQ
jgi:hypothetical protein